MRAGHPVLLPMSLLFQLLVFAATLVSLLALSRWIARQVQVIGLRLTGNPEVALMAYYLLLLPGILLHELSHMAMAKLLGLKVGRFTLGPRKRGRAVELGSVTISSGGALADSLVGLAPFLAGTAVLVGVGYWAFDVAALGRAWMAAGWGGVWRALGDIWLVPDLWLWAYVVFTVSNAMAPSPADRQPWLVAGVYLGAALALVYLLGGLSGLAPALREHVTGILQMLMLAFLFTLGIDAMAAVALLLTDAVIMVCQGRGGT